MDSKPYAESCDQNNAPILKVLLRLFADSHSLLEIGSGTGQHAVHFAAAMPHLIWQTSDVETNHAASRPGRMKRRYPIFAPPWRSM
jgi:tRNA G46 methylase TrmB